MFFLERRPKVQASVSPPALGRFSAKSSKVSIQASWRTNKPDSNPKQQAVQEVTKEAAKLVRPHNSRPGISVPSWAALTCRPVSLAIPTHLPILQDLALPIPHPLVKLAGRTAEHLAAWKKKTSDQWVLQAVSGYRLEFTSEPQQSHRPVTVQSGHKAAVISDEIGKMVEKGAIQGVKGTTTDGFFSRLFLVPKKEGQMRPVLNLKATEQVYIPQAFQNGGNAHSEGSTAERRLDHKNRHQRCILRDSNSPAASEISEVSVERKMLSVYVPPICTGACPNGFHEDLETSSGVPEEQRYALCCLHRRPSFAAPGQGKAERILSNSLGSPRIAGIFINYPKSLLEPTQNLVFLGFTINSVEKELSLPAEKLEKIVVEAKTMLKCHTVSARSLAQLIGRMTAAILAVYPAPLHYRGL